MNVDYRRRELLSGCRLDTYSKVYETHLPPLSLADVHLGNYYFPGEFAQARENAVRLLNSRTNFVLCSRVWRGINYLLLSAVCACGKEKAKSRQFQQSMGRCWRISPIFDRSLTRHSIPAGGINNNIQIPRQLYVCVRIDFVPLYCFIAQERSARVYDVIWGFVGGIFRHLKWMHHFNVDRQAFNNIPNNKSK